MLKQILKLLLRKNALSSEERDDLVTRIVQYSLGGALMSDPKAPYPVINSFYRKALKSQGVKNASELSDASLRSIREIITACLGRDSEYEDLMGVPSAHEKTLLAGLRTMTAPGRAEVMRPRGQGSDRSADAVISAYGLRPVAPLRTAGEAASMPGHATPNVPRSRLN